MKELVRFFPLVMLSLLLFGCSDPADSPEAESQPEPPPAFSRAADPQEFFAEYWNDLAGETYLPRELHQRLAGRTPLPQTLALVREHDTSAFLEWYYSKDYLEALRERIVKELASMDYQLSVMDVSQKDAADVLMLANSAPVQQKTMMLQGEVGRKWERLDENTWQLILSGSDMRQRMLLIRKDDSWKLESTGEQRVR